MMTQIPSPFPAKLAAPPHVIRLRILDPHSPHLPIVILAVSPTSIWTLAVISNKAHRPARHADFVIPANGILDSPCPVPDGTSPG